MNKKERILILIAAILLLGTFIFPIWKIDLNAPQYPEGIGLRIWIDKITGVSEYDLNNINKLNHYIGMKEIEPSSIPELKIMPYIVILLTLFGITVALIKNIKFLIAWVASIIILMIIGLYDYYIWGYDYGHDLNPTAPIKVPGMTYQPPLIGSKQLLNMTSVSLPDVGSYLIGFTILISCYILINYYKKVRIKNA
ncbi:MAG: hypothetical protein H6612_15440 [Ignavibacteriales bacterium]|nr:hypothetical protein [Ignavibacteriales bacterium]